MQRKSEIYEGFADFSADESFVFCASGRRVNPVNPQPGFIFAKDIAEHLSKQPMFRGATEGLFQVAQHCVIFAGEMARETGAEGAVYALLSQAYRAYTDNPRLFAGVARAIDQAFGLSFPLPEKFTEPFLRLHANVLLTELRQLCHGAEQEIATLEARGAKPLDRRIIPFGWDRAYARYIEALQTYGRFEFAPNLPAMRGLV